MSDWQLPARLSEWSGAEDIAQNIDAETFYAPVRSLVELLAEDDVVLDSLPPVLESSIIAPLDILVDF